jgi:hypothetical protein
MSERRPSSRPNDRNRRLAEALRANLKRRKGKHPAPESEKPKPDGPEEKP